MMEADPAGKPQAAVPTAAAPLVCSSELHSYSVHVNPELASSFGAHDEQPASLLVLAKFLAHFLTQG